MATMLAWLEAGVAEVMTCMACCTAAEMQEIIQAGSAALIEGHARPERRDLQAYLPPGSPPITNSPGGRCAESCAPG